MEQVVMSTTQHTHVEVGKNSRATVTFAPLLTMMI